MEEPRTASHEQLESMQKVHRFFEMTSAEERVLRNKVAEFGGTVRMFVHPDFRRLSTIKHINENKKDLKALLKAEQRFQKILATQSQTVPPLFILESAANKKEFLQKEARLNVMASRDIYVIRTEMANPDPLSPDLSEKYEWQLFNRPSEGDREQMWEWLVNEFRCLGIKKIIIGGTELYISKDNPDSPAGCLGATMARFKDHFELMVSNLTWPDQAPTIPGTNLQE